MKTLRLTLGLAATCLTLAALAQGPTPLVTRNQDQLIAALKANGSRKDMADACRELAVIGGPDSVPLLLGLLPNPELNHMARYALETMPDPAVTDALRGTLPKLKGLQLVGVIGSLGVRKDPQSVPALGSLLSDGDVEVVRAAARALGSIGTLAAAEALMQGVQGASEDTFMAYAEGLGRVAEALVAQGRTSEALAIYDHYGDANLPQQVRAEALRGAILTRKEQGLPLLRESLTGGDYILFAAAVRAAQEMPGPAVTAALCEEVAKLPVDNRVVVIQTLAWQKDPAALPTLVELAKAGDLPARVAAIRALAAYASPTTVRPLLALLNDANQEVVQTAKESLASVPGQDADSAVLALLKSDNAAGQQVGLELIGRRRMTAAVPLLIQTAGSADPAVRAVALKQVGELGTAAELPALLKLLLAAKAGAELDAAEQAAVAVCARAGEPAKPAEAVVAVFGQASPAAKTALMNVLASLGGGAALQTVRAAAADGNAEVRGAAIRALSDWKTADAAPDLLALAKSAGNPTDQMLGLRGYLGFAANPDVPVAQRLAMCREAAAIVKRPDEQKLLLASLGSVRTIESFEMIQPYLQSPDTKEEAAAALIGVGGDLLKGNNAAALAGKLAPALDAAAAATGNADLAKRARALAGEARKQAAK